MKLLLDENLPVGLKGSFDPAHEVATVRDMGWSGVKNGQLLALMAENGFDALVAMDKNLRFQQNPDKLPVNLVIFDAANNKIQTLKPFVTKLSESLDESTLEKITIIAI